MSTAASFHFRARRGGKYRLLQRLAAGGMGEVWTARNEVTGAIVAIKLCASGPSSEAALRFRQEARVGAMLSHRSVVRIFDLVEEPDGTLVLIMELLRGQTLGRHLAAAGPLQTLDALAVVVPVLSALSHAHESGIVHRDITPENIFLAVEPDGYVIPKLVDFGIAKVLDDGVRTVEGQVLGTPQYMAPEQIRAQGPLDGRSDVFSVGVVLYQTLTNRSPFAATSASASLAAVLEAVVDPDPLIEPALWIEIQRAMAKHPYERHRSAREMADRLLAVAGETEASLSQRLRAPRPELEEGAGAVTTSVSTRARAAAAGAVTSSPEDLLLRPARVRRRAAMSIVAGAVGAAAIAALVTLSRRSMPLDGARKADSSPSGQLPTAAASFVSGLPSALSAPTSPRVDPAPSGGPPLSTASPSASASPSTKPKGSNGGHPPRARHPKPVGTTPGF